MSTEERDLIVQLQQYVTQTNTGLIQVQNNHKILEEQLIRARELAEKLQKDCIYFQEKCNKLQWELDKKCSELEQCQQDNIYLKTGFCPLK